MKRIIRTAFKTIVLFYRSSNKAYLVTETNAIKIATAVS
jgi:hypothetical protein